MVMQLQPLQHPQRKMHRNEPVPGHPKRLLEPAAMSSPCFLRDKFPNSKRYEQTFTGFLVKVVPILAFPIGTYQKKLQG